MARRISTKQSEHDATLHAAEAVYRYEGKHVWTNPGAEKNKAWKARYIDVIVVGDAAADVGHVIEVETEDSVSESEAHEQWRDYDSVCASWHLAVPDGCETIARDLLQKYGFVHCTVIRWKKNTGVHTFWELPGLPTDSNRRRRPPDPGSMWKAN